MRDRDIDYAAVAVEKAIREKFGQRQDLARLTVVAQERTICVADGKRTLEGTRDQLLASIRRAGSYDELWS